MMSTEQNPYVPLDYLREHFRVVDPEVQMEREMSTHQEV